MKKLMMIFVLMLAFALGGCATLYDSYPHNMSHKNKNLEVYRVEDGSLKKEDSKEIRGEHIIAVVTKDGIEMMSTSDNVVYEKNGEIRYRSKYPGMNGPIPSPERNLKISRSDSGYSYSLSSKGGQYGYGMFGDLAPRYRTARMAPFYDHMRGKLREGYRLVGMYDVSPPQYRHNPRFYRLVGPDGTAILEKPPHKWR